MSSRGLRFFLYVFNDLWNLKLVLNWLFFLFKARGKHFHTVIQLLLSLCNAFLSYLRGSLQGSNRSEMWPLLSLPSPIIAAWAQAPGAVVSAAEPLVSLLVSAETSLNSFARELGCIGHTATDLLFEQNE